MASSDDESYPARSLRKWPAPQFLAPEEALEGDLTDDDVEDECQTRQEESKAPIDGDNDDACLQSLKRARGTGIGVPMGPWQTFTTLDGHIKGLTENHSATYLSTGNACLDFFFSVVPRTDEDKICSLLEAAWKEDPLQALKLIFQLRGVRGVGKSDKESFYSAALWLHKKHPATLRENLAQVFEFGYFKDLLELVARLVDGPSRTRKKKEEKARHLQVRKQGKQRAKAWAAKQESNQDFTFRKHFFGKHFFGKHFSWMSSCSDMSRKPGYYARKGAAAREAKKAGDLKSREERIAASIAADQIAKTKAAAVRREKRLRLVRRVVKVYSKDATFQALYLDVAKVFAAQLKTDCERIAQGRPREISLAAKWAPSLDGSYDRRTLLCYAIATKIFPKQNYQEYNGVEDRKYGFAVRDRFRTEVLVPLRQALELPEVFMSARKWGEVKYARVASVAMKNYKAQFLEHDKERFSHYLEAVKKGEKKIAAGALLPHQIVRGAMDDEGQSAEVAELQWKRMVQDLKDQGTLKNCLAVCDVSGSMAGEPMDVCIALGVLLSELCEKPWKDHVITFSHRPQIHEIVGVTLKEKYEFTIGMDWASNTNLQAVFDTLLWMAKLNRVTPDKMVRRLFVFSDMEFDEASTTAWETDYEAISRKFKAERYGTPPELVFWNLRSSNSIPVVKSQKGVALVSGFSKNILKVFLQKDGEIDPLSIMQEVLDGEEYSKLKVVD